MATSRDEAVSRVLKCFAERKDGHALLCEGFARAERAYYAHVDQSEGVGLKDWMSQLYPPYAMQVADTVTANLVDDRVRFQVKPRPRMTSPDELLRHSDGARAHELLLSYQMDVDRYARKRVAFVHQNVKKGFSVGKVFWKVEHRLERGVEAFPVYDDLGLPVGIEEKEVERSRLVRNDPTFEVVKNEDFLWADGAVELQRSPWIIHRVAATLEELQALQKAGVYKNVGDLGQSTDQVSVNDEFSSIEMELWQEEPYKHRIELLEYWTREDGALRCITVANRSVLLADRRHVFSHGEYPFVVCATRPNEFRIPGRSIVEAITDLQNYVWTLDNQTLDNIRLSNNFMLAYRDDLIDQDQLGELFPGKMIATQGDVESAFKQIVPDASIVQFALMAAARVKGDLQNVTGGMPFMSGTESSTVDQQTATGVSIITSLAQRMLASQKQELLNAEEEIGNQMVALNQQFKNEETLVPVIGLDGARSFEKIAPDVLAGSYTVNVEPANESMMRQERRAEAQALLTTALQAAPVFAMLAQSGSAPPLNMKAFMDEYLRAYDVDDPESFYSAVPQPMAAAPGQPGQPQAGSGGQTGGEAYGMTSPLAYGPQGPNHPSSLSGEQFVQRLMSQMGGANNSG